MKVYLIGVGMGNPATLTGQALEAIGDSPVLVGAPRLLEPWGAEHDCVPLIAAADIAAYVDKAPRGPATPDFTAGPRVCGPCWGTTR